MTTPNPESVKPQRHRFWPRPLAFAACGGVAIALAGTWFDRTMGAQSIGFEHYFERYYAAKAGFTDPTKYRSWLASERAFAEQAEWEHTAKERQEKEHKAIADRPQLACTAAQMAIKERLVSFSGAKFPYCSDWPGHVHADGANRWVVTSWVDMPDLSGVIRQRGYQVSVTRDADGKNWRTFILRLP